MKYVFSFINLFDHVMTSTVIESEKDSFEVAKEALLGRGYDPYEESKTLEDLKCFAFDCDSMFEIIEI